MAREEGVGLRHFLHGKFTLLALKGGDSVSKVTATSASRED